MYGKILVTTDGSELSEEAFPHVALLAGEESEVVLVTVIDSVARVLSQTSAGATELAAPLSVEAAADSVEAQRQQAEVYLSREQELLVAAGLRKVSTRIEGGLPGDAIVECAKEFGADVIVISTHGRSGWKRALLGAVADHVVRHVDGVPVLLVHPASPQ